MEQIEVGKLIIDYGLYPRAEVDAVHLHYMRMALQAGVVFPPIVAWAKSLRVTDGVHRTKMYLAEHGANHLVDWIPRNYRNEADAFMDAMRLNANHGRTLTRFDRVHSILRAEELGLSVADMAGALGMTADAVGFLRADRVGRLYVRGKRSEPVPLKRTIRHMAGRNLTQGQVEANEKLSGMEQLFYVNQLLALLGSDLIDHENEALLTGLGSLLDALAEYLNRRDKE